jgi:transforming growth factor-beta-induced protein
MTLAQELPLSILDIAKETTEHTTFVAALYKADLVKTLSKANPITLFAPNDAAFRATGDSITEILENPALADILKNHIVAKKWIAADLIAAIDAGGGSTTLETLGGQTLTLSVVDGNIILNDSVALMAADLEAQDGIIHTVDGVIQ